MKSPREHYTIGLDARQDLCMAGESTSDTAIRRFEGRYRAAAKRLAREYGVAIEVDTGGAVMNAEAESVWQRIHDLV